MKVGPIPAHAGQPGQVIFSGGRLWAYPRARGATPVRFISVASRSGLSPRTRGNHPRRTDAWPRSGPIPAHAGQPGWAGKAIPPFRAYPRARGATIFTPILASTSEGLSPRTRGNPLGRAALPDRDGPIPAHAGQPTLHDPITYTFTAYPRARGATYEDACNLAPSLGLSPRTRGNLVLPCFTRCSAGPIPAHAGQPAARPSIPNAEGAYPRARGATGLEPISAVTPVGLSPRTRGNQGETYFLNNPDGPIPAHAGQPLDVKLLSC